MELLNIILSLLTPKDNIKNQKETHKVNQIIVKKEKMPKANHQKTVIFKLKIISVERMLNNIRMQIYIHLLLY